MASEISIGLQGMSSCWLSADDGNYPPENISTIKRNSCGKALNIARMSRDMHGGNGIAEEYHVMRHLMNLETVNTYEGTHDVHAIDLGTRNHRHSGIYRIAHSGFCRFGKDRRVDNHRADTGNDDGAAKQDNQIRASPKSWIAPRMVATGKKQQHRNSSAPDSGREQSTMPNSQ